MYLFLSHVSFTLPKVPARGFVSICLPLFLFRLLVLACGPKEVPGSHRDYL